jgi:hypothetical protein
LDASAEPGAAASSAVERSPPLSASLESDGFAGARVALSGDDRPTTALGDLERGHSVVKLSFFSFQLKQ